MGFFDSLTNMSPDQNQGLLALASSLLQSGGYSRVPVSTGQALGAGLQAFQQGIQSAEDRAYQQQLRSLQMEESRMTAEDRKRKRELEQQIQSAALASVRDPAQMALAAGGGPTQANAQAMQAMPHGGFDEQGFINRVNAVDPLRAMEFQRQFAKAAPEFDTKINYLNGPDGRPVAVLVNKAGQIKTLEGMTPREKAEFLNLGSREVAVNPYDVQPGQQFQRSISPDTAFTQARIDARQREELAAGGKPPPGYRWTPEGTLAAIPGGPGDKLPESQQKQVVGVNNLSNAIREYRSELGKFGKLDALSPDARARMGTKYNNMMLQAKEAYNLGVLNGPDFDILQSVITDPRSVKGVITSKSALDTQASELDRIMQDVGGVSSKARQPQQSGMRNEAPQQGAKRISLADIAETARKSGRTTAEVTAAARAKGYTIGD